jgi:hypothetical protein
MNSLNYDYGQSITNLYPNETQNKMKLTNHINEQSITPTIKETLIQWRGKEKKKEKDGKSLDSTFILKDKKKKSMKWLKCLFLVFASTCFSYSSLGPSSPSIELDEINTISKAHTRGQKLH